MEDSLNNLDSVIRAFSECISNFPIGTISLEDVEPVENRIRKTQATLLHQNAQLLMLKAQCGAPTEEVDDEDEERILKELQDDSATVILNNKLTKLCLHSNTIQSILAEKEGTKEIRVQLLLYMRKLFALNDSVMSLQKSITTGFQQQLQLKIEGRKALVDYKIFLDEKKQKQAKEREKIRPAGIQIQKGINSTLHKINLMKTMIRAFISKSGPLLIKKPILLTMLENHRDSVTSDTIEKMMKNTSSQSESNNK